MAQAFVINGGKPLRGSIAVRGSKNAASKMMIASLLTGEPCVIENVPLSSEIDITKELCEQIGSHISMPEEHTMALTTTEIKTSQVTELTRRNRIPILALGPLLHRKGFAEVPVPGGDSIGHRPINFHIEGLNKMGVRIEWREHSYYAEADHIRGADIELPYPSVGATENIMLTAVLADGKTVIRNAAVEPEILNLAGMLISMGARITHNADTREISIEGVSRLKGVRTRVLPDRNEIVSFACAALATAGEVYIEDGGEQLVSAFVEKIISMGGSAELREKGIYFTGSEFYRPLVVETMPHPGFMTDWQQPLCVVLTQAEGESIIHETVYEDRFGYIKDLKRMGARIETSDECLGAPCRFQKQTFIHSIRINGPCKLSGSTMTMTDIRAGMAHIVAALAADGESVISGIEHADRGYEKIDERLRSLGADIKRVMI